jgi:hypothetical protein
VSAYVNLNKTRGKPKFNTANQSNVPVNQPLLSLVSLQPLSHGSPRIENNDVYEYTHGTEMKLRHERKETANIIVL